CAVRFVPDHAKRCAEYFTRSNCVPSRSFVPVFLEKESQMVEVASPTTFSSFVRPSIVVSVSFERLVCVTFGDERLSRFRPTSLRCVDVPFHELVRNTRPLSLSTM